MGHPNVLFNTLAPSVTPWGPVMMVDAKPLRLRNLSASLRAASLTAAVSSVIDG